MRGVGYVLICDFRVKNGEWNNFTSKTINITGNKTLARYILCKLERQLSGIPIDWNDSKVIIGHSPSSRRMKGSPN